MACVCANRETLLLHEIGKALRLASITKERTTPHFMNAITAYINYNSTICPIPIKENRQLWHTTLYTDNLQISPRFINVSASG